MKRIMIAAAGTGGHVFPALAVAQALREQEWQVDWLGTTENRLEATVVPAHGFELIKLPVQGLRGHGWLRKLRAPLQIIRAVWQCRRVLQQQHTDLVLTFGGYVSGPAGIAARLLKLPLLVHEQNAMPGMTTRLLAKFADQVMVGFAATKQQLPDALVTGNPFRAEILNRAQQRPLPSSSNKAGLRVLVMGGSLGAQALNEALPQMVAKFSATFPATGAVDADLTLLHQAGAGKAAATTTAYQAANLPSHINVQVTEFIDDVDAELAAADLVICRAGALTVAEIATMGVAALLVPLPHAVDDHQTANAQALVAVGAAVCVAQAELVQTGASIFAELLSQPQRLQAMAANAKAVALPAATQAVVAQCEQWHLRATHSFTEEKQ